MSNSIAGESISTSGRPPLSGDEKIWIFPEETAVPGDLAEVALGSGIIAGLLLKRGIKTAEAARHFLDETSYVPSDPHELPDVAKAVTRIFKAIESKQKITIYGDYDVDGVTATSVLLTVLKKLGAEVDYYIPNRVGEGYGLNLKAISILSSRNKTKLIITCDCGVSNFAEINFARSLSVDTIVLDHHTMPEVLPPAVAVVHPKLLSDDHPLYNLPGVGVAYKVCEALLAEHGEAASAAELLDFVTLGMIADLVPLVKENRYLVKIGLEKLVNTTRVGLKALLAQVNGQNDTDLVGFGLAPRLNAAGRLSDANKAVELLTTSDSNLASELAGELQTENLRRQELCEKIFGEADVRVQRQANWQSQKCIAIYDRDWHHGVVGIVASRLVEKYHRPVFIGQLDAEEGVVKGSARGVEQLDLFEVLKANEHLLNRWGGHKMAAGFTVDYAKADELCRALVNTCNRMLSGKPLCGIVEIDMVVKPENVDLTLARQLRVLAPFGMSNRKPRFCMKRLQCLESRDLGKDGKHSRIMLAADEGLKFESVMWNSKGRVPREGEMIDLVFSADVNNFNGKERLQLVINDWRAAREGAEFKSIDEVADLMPFTTELEVQPAPLSASSAQLSGTISGATPTAFGTAGAQGVSSDAGGASPEKLSTQTLVQAADMVNIPLRQSLGAIRQVWRDLRQDERPHDLIRRAVDKLGSDIAIFAEATQEKEYKLSDRFALQQIKHLMLWQFPPSATIFKDILTRTFAENVYLVGNAEAPVDEPAFYLKRLYGLVRYAVNQKDGKVESDKLTALMASTKMSLALALAVLKNVHLIDWFADDGIIHLDCLGNSEGNFEDCPEFQQLADSLDESKSFRNWCAVTPVKEIQLALIQHGVSLSASHADDPISASTRHNAGSTEGPKRAFLDEGADSMSLEQRIKRINEIYDDQDK